MSQPKFPLNKVVLINWRDATADNKWKPKEEYTAAEPSEILTVGFLLKQTKKTITVIMNQATDGDLCSSIAIPKDWCINVRTLATFKPRKRK